MESTEEKFEEIKKKVEIQYEIEIKKHEAREIEMEKEIDKLQNEKDAIKKEREKTFFELEDAKKEKADVIEKTENILKQLEENKNYTIESYENKTRSLQTNFEEINKQNKELQISNKELMNKNEEYIQEMQALKLNLSGHEQYQQQGSGIENQSEKKFLNFKKEVLSVKKSQDNKEEEFLSDNAKVLESMSKEVVEKRDQAMKSFNKDDVASIILENDNLKGILDKEIDINCRLWKLFKQYDKR